MPYKDKVFGREQHRAYMKVWYLRNKKKQVERVKASKAKIKIWFDGWKKTLSCSRCEERDPDCLDFHHLDRSQKDYGVAQMIGFSIKRILEEASKCVVLCSNCHRKLHAREKNTPRPAGVSQEKAVNFKPTSVFAPIAPMAPRHEAAIIAPATVDAEPIA